MIGEILMTKYKYFNTYQAKMSQMQKKSLYDEYKSNDLINTLTFKEFFDMPGIFEMVSMQCLNCEHQIDVSFLYYKPTIDAGVMPFPIEDCPKCETHQLVPREVFNKLNR